MVCLRLPIYEASATIHNYLPLSCVSKKTKIGTDMGSNCFTPSSQVKSEVPQANMEKSGGCQKIIPLVYFFLSMHI